MRLRSWLVVEESIARINQRKDVYKSSRQRWRSSGELETMDPGLECSRDGGAQDGGRGGRPAGSDLCTP